MSDISQLIEWRRELHTWPELSGQEFATTARLRSWLEAAGIRVADYPLKTGLVAEIGHGDTVIALRADIDALPINESSGVPFHSRHPGVMHACGHDLHTTVMLGAALQLNRQADRLPGRVRILFQPAEETGAGARQLIEAGVLENVQAIFGMHNEPSLPVGTFATRSGPFYANADRFTVRITGKEAHAARPEQGVDSIVIASQIIQALQGMTSRSFSALESLVLSITRIKGGNSWNVLPGSVTFDGTARTHDLTLRAELEQRVGDLVDLIARASGAQGTLEWHSGPPVLINDDHWVNFSSDLARQAGFQTQTSGLHLLSEDFAYYLQQVPGAFISLGSASEYGLHHPSFTPGEALIAPAADYFAQLACQALQHLNGRCCSATLN